MENEFVAGAVDGRTVPTRHGHARRRFSTSSYTARLAVLRHYGSLPILSPFYCMLDDEAQIVSSDV